MNLDSFQKNGVAWPISVCGNAISERLITNYQAFQSETLRQRKRQAFVKAQLISRWLDDIVHNDTKLDIVECAIGPNILLWTSDLIVKRAGAGTYVGWHQELPYYELATNKVISVWLAITPSNCASGCMRVLPGTHLGGTRGELDCEGDLWEAYETGRKESRAKNLISFEHISDDAIDDEYNIDIDLQPGEMSIHHCQVIHGGLPNTANYDRIGSVIRFIAADNYCRGGRDTAMLVRGTYRGNHFDLEARPETDFHPDAMKTYDKALARLGGFGDRPLN